MLILSAQHDQVENLTMISRIKTAQMPESTRKSIQKTMQSESWKTSKVDLKQPDTRHVLPQQMT